MLNIVSATSIDICVTIPQQVKKQTSPSRPTTKQLKDPLDQSNSSQSPALTSPPIAAAAADALESSPAATAAAAAGSPLVDESAASPGTATNVDMSSLTTASPITVSTAKEIQYSGIIVRCSTDASFSHIIEEAILLTPGTNPTKKMLAAAADHTIQVEHLLQDEIYKSETSEDDEPSMRVVSFKNLESGKMYYFDVFATFENIQGAHTTPPEGIFVGKRE